MLVCPDLDAPADAPADGDGDVDAWVEEMDGRGIRILGEVIRPEREAKSVHVRAGELVVTDGPLPETTEAVAGFDVLECFDMDDAVRVAAAHPMARAGVLELRPFREFRRRRNAGASVGLHSTIARRRRWTTRISGRPLPR